MKKGEKYVDTTDFTILEFVCNDKTENGHVCIFKDPKTIINRYFYTDEMQKIIQLPTSKEHLAEILGMTKEGEGYLDNGTYLSVFELEMLYNTIVLSKVELFNKIRRR